MGKKTIKILGEGLSIQPSTEPFTYSNPPMPLTFQKNTLYYVTLSWPCFYVGCFSVPEWYNSYLPSLMYSTSFHFSFRTKQKQYFMFLEEALCGITTCQLCHLPPQPN